MNGTLGGLHPDRRRSAVAGRVRHDTLGRERVARVLSDRTGRFTVVVRPGTYTLKVTAEGFDDVVLEDREVLPGKPWRRKLIVLAYRANEPASSVIPLALISILGLAAMACSSRESTEKKYRIRRFQGSKTMGPVRAPFFINQSLFQRLLKA